MIMRIIIRDLREGLRESFGKIILFILFISAFSLGKYFSFLQLYDQSRISGIGILCANILSGIPEYIPDFSQPIVFPVSWVVLITYLPFLLGDYVKRDLQGMGIQKILLSGRSRWWIGKCAYVLTVLILYLGIIYGIPILISTIGNGQVVPLNEDILIYTYGFSDMYANLHEFWGYVLIMPFLCCLAIAIWTTVIGMIWSPEKAFMTMAIYLVVGIFYMNPVLVGNQFMLFRSIYFNENGIQLTVGIWIDCILILTGMITGLHYIENKNLID